MSYEPTTWKDGDLVTSAKLNKLEQGVASAGGSGGGVLVVHIDENEVLDRTWQEIYDADFCLFKDMNEIGAEWLPIRRAYYDEDENIYIIYVPNMNHTRYTTDNPNGYPTYNEDQGPK